MLSLSPLTVLPCHPLDMIRIASETGYDAVGLRPRPVIDGDVDIVGDPPLRRQVLQLLKSTGVQVFDLEVVRIGPQLRAFEAEPTLEFGAEAGAKTLTINGPPLAGWRAEAEAETAQRVAELCDYVRPFGVSLMLEFMVFRGISTLADALRFVRVVGQSNLGLCIDALHYFRSGGAVSALRDLDPALITGVQLCDGPVRPPADALAEARSGRLYPGEGGLPLLDFLNALPAGVPLSVEVPNAQKRQAGPRRRAEDAMRWSQALIAQRSH